MASECAPRVGALARIRAVVAFSFEVEIRTIVAPDGGVIAKSEAGTGPNETSVALSSSTGVDEPVAYTANRSGIPRAASHAS